MSIKIYNGHITSLDLRSIVSILDRERDALCAAACDRIVTDLAAQATRIYDRRALGLPGDDPINLQDMAFAYIRERKRRRAGLAPDDSLIVSANVDLQFFSTSDDHSRTLILAFGNDASSTKSLLTTLHARDYSYWDNADPDEDVSPEEWRARLKDWEAALGPMMTPARRGVAFALLPDDLHYDLFQAMKRFDPQTAQPSLAARACDLAIDAVRTRRTPENATGDQIVRHIINFKPRDPAIAAEIAEVAGNFASRLPDVWLRDAYFNAQTREAIIDHLMKAEESAEAANGLSLT